MKNLNIVFFPIEAVGHMNACIGVGQILLDAGHRVQFLISEQWKGKLVEYGFGEVVIPQQTRPQNVDPTTFWSDLFKSGGVMDGISPLESTIAVWTKLVPIFIKEAKDLDPILEIMFKELKPDVLILDQCMTFPSVEKSGIPWINSCSFQPLFFIDDERTPPKASGYSVYGDKSEWKRFRDSFNRAIEPLSDSFNEWVVSRGVPPLDKYQFMRDSKFMNIYGFPLELDYLDVRPLPPNWYRFDNLKRTEALDFEMPDQLKNKPGKLIYFSMGTIGTGELDLMRRLIAILADSPNRFIVSKGPHHDKLLLPDNMWGQQSVPQIQVLPIVDLVITHGGNNTIGETFFFGKPMLVMPIFSDQHDNAQRIEEKGFGMKLNPHKCGREELLSAIESLLADKEMAERLRNISKRIQTENSIAKLPKMIEQRLKEWKTD